MCCFESVFFFKSVTSRKTQLTLLSSSYATELKEAHRATHSLGVRTRASASQASLCSEGNSKSATAKTQPDIPSRPSRCDLWYVVGCGGSFRSDQRREKYFFKGTGDLNEREPLSTSSTQETRAASKEDCKTNGQTLTGRDWYSKDEKGTIRVAITTFWPSILATSKRMDQPCH